MSSRNALDAMNSRKSSSAAADRFGAALALHQQGRIDDAARVYRDILLHEPRYHEALHYLGVTAIQKANYTAAIKLIGEALAIEPRIALAHANLGHAFLLDKKFELAIGSFSRAVELDSKFANAYYNRANALREMSRLEEAVADYDCAIASHVAFPDAYNNRGLALYKLGKSNEALASYADALRYAPNMIGAWNNRGNALRELRRSREALASYERALQINPRFAEAYNNRGMALRDAWELDAALASYDRALEFKPDYLEAANNRANLLMDLKRYDQAAVGYAEVSRIAPEEDYTLGNVLWSRLSCCDWTEYDLLAAQVADDLDTGRRLHTPFTSLFATDDERVHLRCARNYATRYYSNAAPLRPRERREHERIRVAYLSADFHDHATARLAVGLFERHDRQKFEVIAVSFGHDDASAMRGRLGKAFDRFIDVRSKSDVEIAQMLLEMEVDIAVDLKGFTSDHRLGIFAYRPAPIQVNYLGFPGTMGAEFIDYMIADREVLPEERVANYAEKIVYLPNCYQPNDSSREIAAATTRAQCDLPDGAFVFCCFNGSYKITPSFFDIWMRLLAAIPESVLWLLDGGAAAKRNLRREATQRGIDAKRLIFAPHREQSQHLARIRLADLFLDTLPINAHTTASDALWAGVPVLTCRGQSFAGRVATSLLHAVNLPELIAADSEAYEMLAIRLARTPSVLENLRAKLAENRSVAPLFDTELYCRRLESAFSEMWRRYRRGESPESFSIS